jgi:hypothetical protein
MNQRRSIHSKTEHSLAKILWRWENDWIDVSRVSFHLNQRLDDITTRSDEISGKRWILRPFRQMELSRFDELLGEIVRNIARMEFSKAVEQITEAGDLLKELLMALPMIEQYSFIQKSINELKKLTGAKLFANTPTMKMITDLQEKNRLYLENKEIQKTRLNLFVCWEEIKQLTQLQIDPIRSDKLKEKADYIAKALERTNSSESLGKNEKKYFLMIGKLKELIQTNHVVLAERLLLEFESQVGDRILFFSVDKYFSDASKNSKSRKSPKMKKMSQEYVNRWDDESKRRLKKNLKIDLNRLRDTGNQLNEMIEIIKKEK